MQKHQLLAGPDTAPVGFAADVPASGSDGTEVTEEPVARNMTFLETPTMEADQMDTPMNPSANAKKGRRQRPKPRRIRRSMESEIKLRALSSPFEIGGGTGSGDLMGSCCLCCVLTLVSVVDLVGVISSVYYATNHKSGDSDDSSDTDTITDGKVHYLFDPWVYLLIGSLYGLLMCPVLLYTHYSNATSEMLSAEVQKVYESSESFLNESHSDSLDVERQPSEIEYQNSQSEAEEQSAENIARVSHAKREAIGFDSWKRAVLQRVNYPCLSIFSALFELVWSIIGFVFMNELSENEMASKMLSNVIILWAIIKCIKSVITLLNYLVGFYCDCDSQ